MLSSEQSWLCCLDSPHHSPQGLMKLFMLRMLKLWLQSWLHLSWGWKCRPQESRSGLQPNVVHLLPQSSMCILQLPLRQLLLSSQGQWNQNHVQFHPSGR